MIGSDPMALVNVLADDPYPIATLLRDAVEAHCARTGESMSDVAAAAGLLQPALSRAMREGANPTPPTVRRILTALRLRALPFAPTT